MALRLFYWILIVSASIPPAGFAQNVAQSNTANQEPTYSFVFRNIQLNEALSQLILKTDISLAYEPAIIGNSRIWCVIENATAEAVLRCVLADTELDFVQLSSGTYVVIQKTQLPPALGSLSGIVLDYETGQPLSNAHVMIAGRGTTTNQAGFYTFPDVPAGGHRVTITHVSYQPWRDSLDVIADNITQSTAGLKLATIVNAPLVVNGLSSRSFSEIITTDKINPENPSLQTGIGSPGVLGQIRLLGGIQMHDGTAEIHIQGGAVNEHQMRLDGVPVFLPHALSGLISPFSMLALSQINVHKAGFSARIGSQSGGIIESTHALDRTTSADFVADALSINGRLQYAYQPNEQTGFEIMFAGRQSLWNQFAPAEYKKTLQTTAQLDSFLLDQGVSEDDLVFFGEVLEEHENNAPKIQLNFNDYHLALRWRLSKAKTVQMSGYSGKRNLGQNSYVNLNEIYYYNSELLWESSESDDYDWSNQLAQIQYNAILSPRTLLNVQLKMSRYSFEHRYALVQDWEQFQAADQYADSSYWSDSTQASYPIVPDSTIKIHDVISDIRDQNFVDEYGLNINFSYMFDQHKINIGVSPTLLLSEIDTDLSNLQASFLEDSLGSADSVVTINHQQFNNIPSAWRVGSFIEDEWQLTENSILTLGSRFTWLNSHQELFIEPRISFRTDLVSAFGHVWAFKTAAGIYRQYVNQFDQSTFDITTLLPHNRIWLPVDPTVKPPKSYHLSQAILFKPSQLWTIKMEGWIKAQPNGLAINYQREDLSYIQGAETGQSTFLIEVESKYRGFEVELLRESKALKASFRYRRSMASKVGVNLFAGTDQGVAWNEPHRYDFSLDWQPISNWMIRVRSKAVLGRSWGFRRVYYDYFGHSEDFRYVDDWDFGRPADHVLPALLQTNIGITYTKDFKYLRLQARFEVLNVTNRKNVAEWRLNWHQNNVTHEDELRKSNRYLHGRLPTVGLRITL